MTLGEVILGTLAALNIIGGAGLIVWLRRQIGALKRTVEAQRQTIETVGKVNETVLNVIDATDPERWRRSRSTRSSPI